VTVLEDHTSGTPLYTPPRSYTPEKFWHTLGCTIHPVDKHCFKAVVAALSCGPCDLCELFPNVCIRLRIFLTIPATATSAETCFSKLKLVKNYMRSAVSQSRLVDLARLKVGSCIPRQVDFDNDIRNFVNDNTRKSLR